MKRYWGYYLIDRLVSLFLFNTFEKNPTPLDWISRIKEDENKALEELYKMFRDECIAWIYKQYKLDPVQAKEIFQSSVITLYDNVISDKLTKLTSTIKSYLFSICRNKSLEYMRSNVRKSPIDQIIFSEDHSYNDIEEKKIFESRLDAVNLAMQRMGDPCKSVLKLYYYKRMSMDEISELMGYKNADTAKNQKYKCLKRLQLVFKNHKQVSN